MDLLQETRGPLGHLMKVDGRTLRWADLKNESDWEPRFENEAGDLTPGAEYGDVMGLESGEGKVTLVCERGRFEVIPLAGDLSVFVYGWRLMGK